MSLHERALKPDTQRFARMWLWLALLSLAGLVVVAWLGWRAQLILPMSGDRYLLELFGVRARASNNFVELLLSQLPLALILLFALASTAWLMVKPVASQAVLARRHFAMSALLWVLGLFVMVLYGAAQPWYPIEKLLNFQGGVPFQHRMLLALPAIGWQWFLPDRPVLEGYLLSQAIALAFTIWASYWLACGLVQRAHAIGGPALSFAAWASTLTYFTFYDIAIVGFFALALRLLMLRQAARYLAVFAIATLNHEISLLLVVVALAIRWRQDSWQHQAGMLVAQLLVYGALRATLFALLPMEAAWQGGKPAFNWLLLTHRTQEVVFALAPVLAFLFLSLWGARFAPLQLRRSLILWPCLLLMTLSVGQLNEGRQFDAYIPFGMACCLCWLSAWLRGEKP